jgi:phosphoenolpyruvate carboxykinase (ATP)
MVGLYSSQHHESLSLFTSKHSLSPQESGVFHTPADLTNGHVGYDEWTHGLGALGMRNVGQVYRNLSVPMLVEHALARGEGVLADNGALCVETGKYTGRSPKDRFIVDDPKTRHEVDWNQFNVPISEDHFQRLYQRVLTYVQGRDLYIFDGYVGADPAYQVGVRVINEMAWQNLFVH